MRGRLFIIAIVVAVLMTQSASALSADYEVTAQTYVSDFGQTVRSFTIEGLSQESAEKVKAEDFIISYNIVNQFTREEAEADVTRISYEDGKLLLAVEEFLFLQGDFVVSYVGEENLNLSFSKAQLTAVHTDVADQFVAGESGAIHYRLYIPEGATEPLPLIVWTHGGGEGGTDNWIQLVANRGAISWIDRYHDVVVLAPQTDDGWSEEESLAIGEVIRELISDGVVDERRVYGSGCSAGGRGCILTASRNGDLYTAIAPICPTMMDDSIEAVLKMTDRPIWITSAFQDHTPERDDYIVAAITALQKTGNENALYTLYQAEEFTPYHLGITEDKLFSEYHFSWVLTLNNEYGVMDWLMAQSK